MRSEQLHQTVVGLVNPRPGTYTIETLPGSPAITKVSEATDPLPAQVKASVHGHGARRTLVYDILRRPRQSVQFVEVSGSLRKPIGTVTGGRGTLAFSPAPGSDVRHIEAQFTLDGIRAETRTVASFRPPSAHLARPAHLRVRRRAERPDRELAAGAGRDRVRAGHDVAERRPADGPDTSARARPCEAWRSRAPAVSPSAPSRRCAPAPLPRPGSAPRDH